METCGLNNDFTACERSCFVQNDDILMNTLLRKCQGALSRHLKCPRLKLLRREIWCLVFVGYCLCISEPQPRPYPRQHTLEYEWSDLIHDQFERSSSR